jgi:CopG family nickel-responsive transcriptional regulator
MRRLTISVDEGLARQFDELVGRMGYSNRSEAFRDLVRRALEERRVQSGSAKHCIANLSYVYNHNERQLASRLANEQHAHHDVTVSAMHVHLDHENCIESLILRGQTKQVVELAQSLMAQTGVRHGKLNVVPVDVESPQPFHRHPHFHPTT